MHSSALGNNIATVRITFRELVVDSKVNEGVLRCGLYTDRVMRQLASGQQISRQLAIIEGAS
jgi:hypothetical protein